MAAGTVNARFECQTPVACSTAQAGPATADQGPQSDRPAPFVGEPQNSMYK
jgi:hypothetical protein